MLSYDWKDITAWHEFIFQLIKWKDQTLHYIGPINKPYEMTSSNTRATELHSIIILNIVTRIHFKSLPQKPFCWHK